MAVPVRVEFLIEPQRSNGVCFVRCELSKATRFAVIKAEQKKVKGKLITRHNKVSVHKSWGEANFAAISHQKAFEPSKSYRLGRRMSQKERSDDIA